MVKKMEKEKNILIFEGEYLNGKRNGKGKEYGYDGSLKFEGEYLNGKRIEKVKQEGQKEGEGQEIKKEDIEKMEKFNAEDSKLLIRISLK